MRWNKDITPACWLLVGAIFIITGIQHMIKQEIFGKVRTAGSPPLLEGWPVFFTGLAELLLGIFLFLWFLKKFRN